MVEERRCIESHRLSFKHKSQMLRMRKRAVFCRVSILKEHHHFQSNGGDNGCIYFYVFFQQRRWSQKDLFVSTKVHDRAADK